MLYSVIFLGGLMVFLGEVMFCGWIMIFLGGAINVYGRG